MKKAIIVGGSMAGMLAGNMLIRQGWEVEILERSREGLEARGAGIVPQRSLLAALARAGVTDGRDVGEARPSTFELVARLHPVARPALAGVAQELGQ